MAESSLNVNRVAMRVPPFWPHDPQLWFTLLEGQFLVSGIFNDDTKYGYVIGSLEARYAAAVKDLIISPPVTEKHNSLKKELITGLPTSQQHKTRQLLEREEIGDRKPSQFLRRLRYLGVTLLLSHCYVGFGPANFHNISKLF